MERVDYSRARASWRTVKTKREDGSTTEQMKLEVRYYVDGKRRMRSKLYPATANLDTDRRRDNAARRLIAELEEEQEIAEREEAKRLEAERAAAEGRGPTVAEYVDLYVDILESSDSVRPSAISDYRTSAKRIAEGIGGIHLRELTPGAVQAWQAELLRDGRGTNTVLKYVRLLNSVCKHAVSVRDLDWNPIQAVKKPRRVAPSPNALTSEQLAQLVATLEAMAPTPTVTAALIAAYTGMRAGEVAGLKWKCYDPTAGTIYIERAIAKAGGRSYVAEPKTAASHRAVPVAPALAESLDRRRRAMVAELEEAGVTLAPEEFGELYVVGHVDGRYYDITVLSRSWKTMAESFDLTGTQGRRITFHDLRHSFATRAIAAGADVRAVAAVLGHASPSVTLNVYADADTESKRRAAHLVASEIAAQGKPEPLAELAAIN